MDVTDPMAEPAVTSLTIAAALEQVGPRLKRLRAQRGATLGGVAAATGISKSTLSRLENGQRRPDAAAFITPSRSPAASPAPDR